MKMNNVLAKTGLALAISAFTAGAAFAGVHGYGNPVLPATDGAIVLANEIFGAGSQDTLIAIPVTRYEVAGGAIAEAAAAATIANSNVATVKYTLDKGAVFGEDLSDIEKWAAANVTLAFEIADLTDPAAPVVRTVKIGQSVGAGAAFSQDSEYKVVVDQGGAIGDNTVTFKITNVSAKPSVLQVVNYGQVRVKNLTAALERGVGTPTVSLGAEFRNVGTTSTDTQSAVVVLRSQPGVALDRPNNNGHMTSYENNGGRARIDVADTELSFTGNQAGNTGDAAAQDFDATDNVAFVNLGTLKVVRTTYNNGAQRVKKENGDDFDFQGSDQPVITLTSNAPLTAYNSIYLNAPGTACGAAGAPVVAAAPVAGADSVQLNLAGQTTAQLEAGYNVCANAAGAVAIPESSFTASLAVSYFNPRYTDSADTLSYGQVLRNGCQVTLFNLPNVNAQDKAMVRLTNVSELPGSVRGFVWTEDGRQIDAGSLLSANLAAHATTVFHTNPSLNSGVYLGDVMSEFAGETTGRHRLVLQGAFPACEALGMVRSPNGTLVNMTSTTYSGDDSRLGGEQSNTSNTTN
ncbi:hypothetical protein [Stutzerimonas stutzeri]|uniref:hypothetical protein n=1 Tax=Stutzerimonas stutzeri TaxID=316 RepID=UPI000F78E767|nr:hypothetical protein [Stutzerimonas stutzeri]